MNQTLADAGHTLVSAGAFVFDDDVMAGTQMDKDGVQIQVWSYLPLLKTKLIGVEHPNF